MEVGVDSFSAALTETSVAVSQADRMRDLLDEIEHADQVGLDVFGVGEHHRKEFLDSAPAVILAAAAARTKRIRLTSAVAVLSAADPVRVFQQFATLDLISQGRAEMVVGRGSFIEAFPLFGLDLDDYDSLFAEKLDLLLKIREDEHVHWSGRHRPALTGQGVYPRPLQNPLPIWLGVGGTPESFVRAGALGLPLMVAIIGGETRRFRPLVDLYRDALAVVYPPYDEDFGYVTLEAFLARKPVVTATDSGGPNEFVADGVNGFVCAPEPDAIAAAINRLAADRQRARSLGDAGYDRARTITWDGVIEKLTGTIECPL